MDKVFVVRSKLDRHQGKPFLAIFSEYVHAEHYRDRIIELYEVPEYAMGLIWIEEAPLDPALIPIEKGR